MESTIKNRLTAGELVRVMHFTAFSSPKLVELVGTIGKLDGLWIDQEHCAISHADLDMMLIACRATGLDAFSRVPLTDYATVMRPMEIGCSGVMIAQVRTMDEVRQAVQWAKYPPVGLRGLFPGLADTRYGLIDAATHVEESNKNRWLAIQIETAEAVEIADEIAATEGVDLLFVGPADLSLTLGVTGQFLHAKCLAALEQVSAACKTHGKSWGTLSPTAEHARVCRDLGCQMFSIFGDLECLRAGLRALEERFAEFYD